MCKLLSGAAVVALAAFVATTFVLADDKVEPDKLPKEVKEAIKKKYPDGEIVGAEKEKEDNKEVYELKVKLKKETIEVTLTPEGKILSSERSIEVKDVPKVVMDAIEKKYPKATAKSAEEITKDDKIAEYEVVIVTKDEKTLEVTFDKDGKFIEEEKVEKKEEPKDKPKDKEDKKG